ncbi:cell cycle control microtubule-binding protein [Ordospora colligata]|uniref:Cell cycle control microtubule-binding protein n=1 Tax=Ordospora colligata OC4 TaxID=1354746 RepID=A0A0B2UN99_9MICR|nr:cell cycle control microtubule-binding protein [Ordospora colligata OC4]KHN70440.1 cell cycle control microtubule-binding protein [Ordospora colligata OC4]TBU17190.1 cell cycle control microtubule-binding protein [Ordospora colligata]TBU19620.1 cell cycle control microtubule-binding protein [Ordospora colligata]
MNRSRQELITWMRSLGIDICGIEDLGKGAAICQVLSILYEDFPHGFITKPREEHEYLRNMKICQEFFGMKSIKLYFPVDKLVKCKMQDNLEVAQWLCKHYIKVMGHDVNRKVIGDAVPMITKEIESMNRLCSSVTVKKSKEKTIDHKEKSINSIKEKIIDGKEKSINNNKEDIREIYKNTDMENGYKYTLENDDISTNTSLLDKHEDMRIDLNTCNDRIKDERIGNLEEEVFRLKMELEDSKRDVYKRDICDCTHGKSGGFDEEEIKELLITFEKERDFYFKKLFTIEKYFLERNGIDEGLKNDVFEILYEE